MASDIRKIRFDGKLNYLNGLLFYFSLHGQVVSFLIKEIGDRRKTIRVEIYKEPNHARPHVHINGHQVSMAIDNGELLAGRCDGRVYDTVRRWIHHHKQDLLDLWNVVQEGGAYQPYVEKIRRDRDFEDFGFKGNAPKKKDIVNGVFIWQDGKLITERNAKGTLTIIGEGDMYVGLPADYQDGSIVFDTKGGTVSMKRLAI